MSTDLKSTQKLGDTLSGPFCSDKLQSHARHMEEQVEESAGPDTIAGTRRVLL